MSDKRYFQFEAGEAITQGAPLKINAAGDTVSMLDADTENMIGVAAEAAASGDQVTVDCGEVVQVLVDGSGTAIDAGDELMGGVSKLIIYASDTGHVRVARALGAADADNTLIYAIRYGSQPVG